MYQCVYTRKHVPLRVLVHVPLHILARVCLRVPLNVQAHVHLSVFLPYENFTWLYTHRSTYTYSGTRKHTCNSTRGVTHTSTRSGTCMRVYTRWYTQARVSKRVKYCRWINLLAKRTNMPQKTIYIVSSCNLVLHIGIMLKQVWFFSSDITTRYYLCLTTE